MYVYRVIHILSYLVIWELVTKKDVEANLQQCKDNTMPFLTIRCPQ